MSLEFKGKGKTLEIIGNLTCAQIKPLLVFNVQAWIDDREKVLSSIVSSFNCDTLIVRSSASNEDSQMGSMAGAFQSVPNVNRVDRACLQEAITLVIESYGRYSATDEFVVQEQVLNIKVCGVVFTRDIDTLAPYYTINYDESGSFDSVTSGSGSSLKTYVRFRDSPFAVRDIRLEPVLKLAHELEVLFGNQALDIEFAIDDQGILFLLQVRPITNTDIDRRVSDSALQSLLLKVQKKAAKLTAPHPGLCGQMGMYSVMTDWNPAEMIGIRPRKLALSLYKELITDSVWAYQRDAYGYRNLCGYPLLLAFLGQPYIDVRVSFNSFVPGALDVKLADKLVDYYMKLLSEQPTYHDKVEFKVVHSCYYLNVSDNLELLLEHGFTRLELDRIKFALLELTNNIISCETGPFHQDLKKVSELPERFARIVSSELSAIEKIYWLIKDCKRYGTLPFAGLARAGFIAMQFLHSFVQLDILNEQEFQAYMRSLNTIARQLTVESSLYAEGKISRENIIEKYGHLRPGTYDILSPSYEDEFENYFSSQYAPPADQQSEFKFSDAQRDSIALHLTNNGVKASVDELLAFIQMAIEGREYGKFLFTKSLSQVLKEVKQLGARHGLSPEQMSYIDIRTIMDMYANLSHEDIHMVLERESRINEDAAGIASLVRLPQLIADERDIYDFYVGDVEPNFITRKTVTEIVVLEQSLMECDLSGKIVFIRSADPGYDWVFSRNIGGLVTMYGGANSHMAIRCAELQIPAVIGCGERNFENWSKSSRVTIDCSNKQVNTNVA